MPGRLIQACLRTPPPVANVPMHRADDTGRDGGGCDLRRGRHKHATERCMGSWSAGASEWSGRCCVRRGATLARRAGAGVQRTCRCGGGALGRFFETAHAPHHYSLAYNRAVSYGWGETAAVIFARAR